MKRWLIPIGVFLVVMLVVGIVVVASGVVPIKASSGHLPPTQWLLSFAMSRSVSTHSLGVEMPANLDDPTLVMKGAGHYHSGCAPCHGSPVWREPRVAQQLAPKPPDLASTNSAWTPEELFYIVKHGVKFTGMPAFPSQQRDDEVWAVVAFLLEYPDLEKEDYRRLVADDVDDSTEDMPRVVLNACARCHGLKGQGRDTGAFPRLAGLSSEYLSATLQAYVAGDRNSGIMEPIAARLSASEIQTVADFYSRQSAGSEVTADPTDAVSRGQEIAHNGVPAEDVGACIACHRLERSKQNPNYPALVGQSADYMKLQLDLFKSQHRGGTKFARLMHPISEGLTSEQMQDVAAYYGSVRDDSNE